MLRFRFLLAFDKALMQLDIRYDVLAAEWLCISVQDDIKCVHLESACVLNHVYWQG